VREFEVLFAPLADVDVASSFEATVQDFAVIVRLEVYRNAGESLSATCGSEEVTVDISVEERYREEPEPFVSHPFSASVKAHDARERPRNGHDDLRTVGSVRKVPRHPARRRQHSHVVTHPNVSVVAVRSRRVGADAWRTRGRTCRSRRAGRARHRNRLRVVDPA